MSDIKTMVRGAYDIQKLRIQCGNRIVGNFKAKLGQAPSQSEETLDERSRELLAKIRGENKLVADGAITELDKDKQEKKDKKIAGLVTELIEKHYKEIIKLDGSLPSKNKFSGNVVISAYTELCLIDQYKGLMDQETRHFKSLGAALKDYPIYTEFLEKVSGIGPAMAGIIVSEIDITKARYPSSLWAYAGLDVAQDGKGRSRRKEHLVECAYTDKDGEPATRVGITFNPFLKTKLMGVLASSFIRANNVGYRKVYDDTKNRLENHAIYKDVSKLHRHNMALRKMVKIFLIDLYNAWRPLEGLEVAPTYQEAKLGHVHGS